MCSYFFYSLTSESQQTPPIQTPFPNYHPRSNSIIPHHSPFQYHLQRQQSAGSSVVYPQSPSVPPQPGFRPMYWQNVQYGGTVSSPPRCGGGGGFNKLPMPLPGQSLNSGLRGSQSAASVVPKVCISISCCEKKCF